ncbi:hypothetical protein RFI_18834 [Reticulomyxa filosa]|uniref:Uncharacterized protein n=1 Tax=Reticulomyxa filosa TaxID=46433 RepID=X6MWR2_RETFI|nr:hypothetical protein RFI_18834 [Reticulomyxa filosa]|eukprot:ETO18433.1 hypothetical protein RFI_18834 [Reticulomyxa filosa]
MCVCVRGVAKHKNILKDKKVTAHVQSESKTVVINESTIINDGLFATKKVAQSIRSADVSAQSSVDTETKETHEDSDATWKFNSSTQNEVQLHLRLGHPTQPKRPDSCVFMRDDLEIAYVNIQSGYTKGNNFQGVAVQVPLPLTDPLFECKFVAKPKRIKLRSRKGSRLLKLHSNLLSFFKKMTSKFWR